ncbi:transcriptional repressor LexA [Magnetovibrio sp. PR-2]|uniref:transcriptional repressor LexA n=1 Tax=Magnetovibrio sp. PR-2 TaxID=3120356 RepID=UPI002FCE1B99
MLTKKQHQLLMLIDERLRETGVPPSFDEMKDALGLKSKSGIHRLISGLEERGFIRRLPHKARALEILKMPENVDAGSKAPAPETATPGNVVRGQFGAKPTPAHSGNGNGMVEVPMLGRIAAGTHLHGIEQTAEYLNIPPDMLGGVGDHFCLEVDGESMIEAGIQDGDTVIIEKTENARNGAIVVALVDGEETTLKYIHSKGDTVALEPANKDHETRIFGSDRVLVQGRLVGLLRKY